MAISRESLGIAMGKRARAAATYSLLMLVPALALAAAETRAQPCDVVEPDSLEISWTPPCQDGSWMLDPRGAGCRLWDWHPAPEDTATWSGACLSGRKEGHGVVQWYEHGRPIDRFEGVFRRGKRVGFGRYDWPAGQRYQGTYETDLPNGQGTVTIDGVSFAGAWRRGCLVHGDKLIAIGIPLSTCGRGKRPMSKAPRPAGAGYGDGGLSLESGRTPLIDVGQGQGRPNAGRSSFAQAPLLEAAADHSSLLQWRGMAAIGRREQAMELPINLAFARGSIRT